MSEISRDMDTSANTNIGPDLFQYYIRGVAELLAQDDILPSSLTTSGLVGAANGNFRDKEVAKENNTCNENKGPVGFGSLFRNAAGDGLSDFKKARLMAMLRQSVVALTREVDEMLDPVFSMRRLRGLMAATKSCASYRDANCKDKTENRAQKRPKIPSSSSLINTPLNVSSVSCSLSREGSPNEWKGVAIPGESLTRCYNKECAKLPPMDKYTQTTNPDESKSLCGDCLKQANKSPYNKDMNESFLGSSSRDDKENGEVNDDLHVLLVNRGPKVEEKLEKHSAELSATLGRMEEKLEELLDIVISSCRPMTLAEKHQLWRLIQNLPPKNLDRVVEIIQRGKPSEKRSCYEITVDLQHEDDITLWRIYFYVKAVENARKLSV